MVMIRIIVVLISNVTAVEASKRLTRRAFHFTRATSRHDTTRPSWRFAMGGAILELIDASTNVLQLSIYTDVQCSVVLK